MLECIWNADPDIVLSDHKMPEMHGIKFTRMIRELSENPVILYTGLNEEKVAEDAFKAGIDDFITKAYDAAHDIMLLKRIKNVVDRYRIKMAFQKTTEDMTRLKNQELAVTG